MEHEGGAATMYESADAVCPFYRGHTAEFIRCENKNKIPVKDWKDAEGHIRSVCGSHRAWKNCPIARELNKRYGV